MSNPQNFIAMRLQFGELNITPRVEERLSELGYTVAHLQDAVARHKSNCDGEPSVYVGTYGKYNDGSLCGLWIDLSSFNSYDDFIEFCQAIHADEEDPELMVQDYEGFPRLWYNEGFIRMTTSTISSNTRICATSRVRRTSMTTWSSTTNSTTSRKPTAESGTAKETLPGTSSASATISKARWAISPATSTTNPSDTSCSCTTTRWAPTITCSATSDHIPPSLHKGLSRKGRLFLINYSYTNISFPRSR